jgi:hypothetical protein
MTSDLRRAAFVLAFALLGGCARQNPEPTMRVTPASPPPPDLPSSQLAAPVIVPVPRGSGATAAPEPRVDIDTHSRDEDVRPLLEFVGRAGGYRLVFPTTFDRRVRVSLTNVPVSVALATLLEAANLTLESSTPAALPAATRGVVFYELPVNVDSLSADAIVKRFGVSLAIAEMIVTSRAKP